MTKVKLHKSLCLGLSGDLLVCEINEQFEPMVGAAQSVWSAAGDELNDFRQMVALPLQECSLQISPPFQLKQKFTKVAHVVVPSVANQTSLTIEERANLKNCYDTLFFKAKEMEMKKVILPFLGKVSANLSTADAVDIAFNAVFDAIQDGEMEAVTEVFFFTTITEVYEAAKAHILYKNRKNMDNRSTGGNTRKCSIGECTTLKPRESRCEGDLISLQSVIGTWKSDSRNSELLGCAHEADLIMCRIGEFAVNWSSVESSRYEICKRHLNMFLLDWKNPFWRNFRSRDGVTQCSFPEHQGPIPMLNRDRNKLVTKSDAERWKGKRNSILRVGIPLCEQDLAFLRGSQFDPVPCQADFDITDSVCDLADHFDRIPPLPKKTKSTADEEVKKAVKHLLDTLNSGSNFERRKDWVYLSDRQKREKVRTARTALNAVIEVLSPDAKDELRGRVLNGGIIRQNESCSPFKKLLTDVAELYERAESKIHRLFILSSVATVELPVLQQFFIGLTPYFHKKARTVRVKGSVDIPHRIIRVRYDEAKMDKLIEFILSPFVVINLPFDERLERMDDGTTMSMPNLMRLQTIDEVYRMYLAYLEEEGILDMALNETTAKFIIKLVAPTRRKNLTCVDEKLADGMTSFDELFSIVDELLKKGFIENDIASTLTKDLQLSKSYLRGDFKAHVKRHSECADHCASYALSDPHSPYLANDCSSGPHAHVHDSICQRCNDVDTTLKTVKELLENAENTAPTTAERSHFSILNEECELHCKAIYEMKNHQMRASLSHDEKAEFVQTLTPGHALITLDWAQKLTPFYAREKQVEYYAKAGIAYHISHALTVKDGEQAEHLSVHIFEPGEKQDGTAVYLIVKEFLLELKQMGINRVMVRSDCAGCYRNAPLICSLMNLQNETGVDIDGLLFCEAQAGKGPCDRGSALVKRHARDHVTTTRGKIETKEQFFNALVTGKLLNAVSVHLCSISDVKEVKSSILNITSYSSFEFEANGIRLRRHRSIGEGLLFDHTRLTPCEGRLEINRSGGHTVDTDDLFWFTKTSHRSREPAKSTTVSPVVSSGILCCPEENCSSEFRSFHMLQKHIFTDKHKYELERKTMHDLVTEMASRSFDTTLTSVSLTHAISSSVHSRPSDLKKGWALRETKKRNSLDKPARDLIRQFFAEKRDAKLKVNPHEAERFMKNARGNGGELLISPRNRLSITQIKSLIRGLLKNEDSSASAKKGKKNVTPVATNESSNESTDEEESDDEEAVRALILSHKNDLFLNDDSSADEDEPSKKRIRGRK